MRRTLRLAALALASWPLAASGAPITYQVDRTLAMLPTSFGTCIDQLIEVSGPAPCPSYTLSGTITTDGTIGNWGFADHIIAMSLTMTDGTSAVAITEHLFFEGSVTTATELIRDPGPPGAGLSDGSGVGWNSCGVSRSVCFETMSFVGGPTISFANTNSVLGVVPEPGTAWLVGLGLALLSARAAGSRTSAGVD